MGGTLVLIASVPGHSLFLTLNVFLRSVSFGHLAGAFLPETLHRKLSLVVAHQAFL